MVLPKGVLKEALEHSEQWDRSKFKGCDIFLDALTIAKANKYRKKLRRSILARNYMRGDNDQLSIYQVIHDLWIKELKSMLDLRPNSLTILVSCTPQDYGMYARMDREATHKILENCQYGVVSVMIQAACEFPQIEICYTNNLVENEVMHRFNCKKGSKRKVLFSAYSNLLRFTVPLKSQLYVCHTYKPLMLEDSTTTVWNVSKCMPYIRDDLVFHQPFTHSKLEFKYKDHFRKNFYALVISGKVHKQLSYVVSYRWPLRTHEVYDFIEVGDNLLKTFFGVLMRDYFEPDYLKEDFVEIWSLKGGQYDNSMIWPLEGEDLEKSLARITKSTLPDLFWKAFTLVITDRDNNCPDYYLYCIHDMLTDVCAGKLARESIITIDKESEIDVCMGYLQAFLNSAGLIDEMFNLFEVERVKCDCTPARLRTYFLNEFSEQLVESAAELLSSTHIQSISDV